jgi:superfamily II DNA or RNA helicase
MGLRPYQLEAVENVESNIMFGEQEIIIEAPTSAGKSHIVAELAKRLEGHIVILVSFTPLINQLSETLSDMDIDHSILKAGRESEFDSSKRINICMAQTYYARMDKMQLKADILIADEYHVNYNSKRSKAIQNNLQPSNIIGLTATPWDADGVKLSNKAEIVSTQTVQELEDAGFLCPIDYYVPKWAAAIDYSAVKKNGSEYNMTDLDKIVNTEGHLNKCIESMDQLDAKNKKFLCFCSTIEQCDNMAKLLRARGYMAEAYHSKVNKKKQELVMDAFKNNTTYNKNALDTSSGSLFEDNEDNNIAVKGLISVSKLSIGFSVQDIQLGVILRPIGVLSLYHQVVGRMKRIHPSKKFAEVLDLGQCLQNHGFAETKYNPPASYSDRKDQVEALLQAKTVLEDLPALLDNKKLEKITIEEYDKRLQLLKKKLEVSLEEMTVKELAAAFEVSRDHKQIISIATIIYTIKYGNPVSKKGNPYKYRPENFWGTSTFGDNTDFHVHHTMEEYFNMYPDQKSKWIKALRTRCRNIIKEKKQLFAITGFIKFMAEEHQKDLDLENMASDDVNTAKYIIESNGNQIEVSEEDIPF